MPQPGTEAYAQFAAYWAQYGYSVEDQQCEFTSYHDDNQRAKADVRSQGLVCKSVWAAGTGGAVGEIRAGHQLEKKQTACNQYLLPFCCRACNIESNEKIHLLSGTLRAGVHNQTYKNTMRGRDVQLNYYRGWIPSRPVKGTGYQP